MLFESHAHYDDMKFDIDRDEILSQLPEKGIEYVINVGADMQSSHDSIKLADKYNYIYAAVGVHPHYAGDMSHEDLKELVKLSKNDKVVAIGEIGLDFYYDNSPREIQRIRFREQIEVAKEVSLPIIFHSREAAKETFDIIKETEANSNSGVIHCYSGSVEMAKEYVEMGFYLGIGGVVTFKNAKKLKDVVKAIPLKHLLIETDSPYLSPIPNRGSRNDSTNLKYIIAEIAKIKEISYEEVENITSMNAKQLFNIK